MQEVPFQIFRNFQAVQNVMGPMVNTKYGNFKESYHVKRLADELQNRYEDFKALHTTVMDDAVWEDNDKTKDLTNKDVINEKLFELFSTTFEMKWAPLPLGIVEALNPTPEQFSVIENLMDPEDLNAQLQ